MELFSYLAEHFDLPILNWVATHLWCPFLDKLMPGITVLGNTGAFWIGMAVVFLFIPKYRRVGLGVGAALLIGLVVCNLTLKPLIARMRPYDYMAEHYGITIKLLIEAPHDFSFPSGHTIASFEAATVLMLHDKKLGIGAVILASLIAFSRLYLYVHYPTDVIVSVGLGIVIGVLANHLAQKALPIEKGVLH